MGLAVLPARLKNEMALLEEAMLENRDIKNDEILSKHYEWSEEIKSKYDNITKENIGKIIKDEIGLVFAKVLEHAGVYKRNDEGIAAFKKFAERVK